MANTYILISSYTVAAGGVSSFTFSSIPSSYTDLKVVFSLRNNLSAAIDNVSLTVNGVSTGYTERLAYGYNGTATSAAHSTSQPDWQYLYQTAATSTANTFSNGEIYIPNYTGSTNKSISVDSVTETNGAAAILGLNSGLLTNTAAITSITLGGNNGNFVQYSKAYLYGIKNS